MVGKYELRRTVWLELDDPLSVINDIAGAGLFCDDHSRRRELAQVDFAISVSRKLLRPITAVHRFDLKDRIGNPSGGIGRIDFHKPESWLQIIKEKQLPNTVSCPKFYLLGRGSKNVTVSAGIPFHSEVSTRFYLREQDLAVAVCLKVAQRGTIPEDLKGHIGEALVAGSVILQNTEGRQRVIKHYDSGIVCRGGIISINVDAMTLRVEQVALWRFLLHNLIIGAAGHIMDIGKTRVVGRDGGHILTVPKDLKGGSGQIFPALAALLRDNEGGLPHIAEGQGHIACTIPMNGLRGGIHLIAVTLNRHLINPIAAQGQLISVELNKSSNPVVPVVT